MCTHIHAYISCIDCEKGSPNQYPDKIFHLRCFASLSSIKEANLKWKVNRYVAGWLCCDFPSVPPWAEAPGHWPCFFHLAKWVNLSLPGSTPQHCWMLGVGCLCAKPCCWAVALVAFRLVQSFWDSSGRISGLSPLLPAPLLEGEREVTFMSPSF